MDFLYLVDYFEKIFNTSKRLEKTELISKLLKETKNEDLKQVILLLQGLVFPVWDPRIIGVANQIVIKAVSIASGYSIKEVNDFWRKTGDLGETTLKLISNKKQATLFSKKLTLDKVSLNLQKIAELEGNGTVDRKIKLIAELITSASPDEAKYITRILLGVMRMGIGEGTLRDSIAKAYDKNSDEIQNAYNLCNDFSKIALNIDQINEISLTIGTPIKMMLALKATSIEDGFDRVGKPFMAEYKYDGFRIQAHKKGDVVKLFTRRLEEVTKQFPEVCEYVKEIEGDFLIEGEAVGFNPETKEYLPFQYVSQRIKRKYDIKETAKKMPVEFNVFEILYYNQENYFKKPFVERRELIEKIVKNKPFKIRVSEAITSENKEEIQKFFEKALADNQEGIMIKKLDAEYKPGSRVGYMLKLKPQLDTLDLAIIGAEWGEGKRSEWLSSFDLAVIDDGELLMIGKAGTGLKEKSELGLSFEEVTKILEPLIISSDGKRVKVKPEVILQVKYQELQKSPTYNSGYALRFPVIERIRTDRNIDDMTTLNDIKEIVKK
jgi:DNA ligase 1